MTKQERKDYIRLARMLDRAAAFADKIEATLANGGMVGCIVGTIADELAIQAGYDIVSKQ